MDSQHGFAEEQATVRDLDFTSHRKLDQMKNINQKSLLRHIYTVFALLFILAMVSSCSRKFSFQTSPVVPAAKGSVKIRKDKNSNYQIKLDVIRLAKPDRLSPPRDIYVVWMQTERDGLKNIGRLETSSRFLSRTLRSSLRTVTPFNPVTFFITAENEANVQIPSGEVILRTGYY